MNNMAISESYGRDVYDNQSLYSKVVCSKVIVYLFLSMYHFRYLKRLDREVLLC